MRSTIASRLSTSPSSSSSSYAPSSPSSDGGAAGARAGVGGRGGRGGNGGSAAAARWSAAAIAAPPSPAPAAGGCASASAAAASAPAAGAACTSAVSSWLRPLVAGSTGAPRGLPAAAAAAAAGLGGDPTASASSVLCCLARRVGATRGDSGSELRSPMSQSSAMASPAAPRTSTSLPCNSCASSPRCVSTKCTSSLLPGTVVSRKAQPRSAATTTGTAAAFFQPACKRMRWQGAGRQAVSHRLVRMRNGLHRRETGRRVGR